MEDMVGALGAVGAVALAVFVVVLMVLTVLLPLSVYSAQKWAHKCFVELQKMNRKLDSMQG